MPLRHTHHSTKITRERSPPDKTCLGGKWGKRVGGRKVQILGMHFPVCILNWFVFLYYLVSIPKREYFLFGMGCHATKEAKETKREAEKYVCIFGGGGGMVVQTLLMVDFGL